MSSYRTPLTEMAFVIEQWLDAPAYWAASPHFSHVDFELGRQVLEEGARFAEEQLLPLRASGDRQGCTFQSGEAGNDGRVTTPEGFALAYARYVEAGWPGLACDMADGGHGLPLLLSVALHEAIFACNHAWAMYTGITQGAYECLRRFATPALRQAWLGKIVSGECLTTMCLTEPQAGSDLGLLRCHASASADGTYRLDGNKIFISGGDHDFTRQIVHLVLARLPDAPLGSRGISMFLVPKLDDQGEPNGVHCTGIEHKMGIRASATCSISFHNARGWLIGAPHGGLTAMFAMMNSARAYVGVQGLAHAHAAEQQALAYAEERVQMRAITRPAQLAQAPADPIASHPAVRHVLLECRALCEGMRVLAYWCAHLVDQARGGEPAQRQPLEARAQLLTPLIKAFCTEQGFSLTSQALQVFGGYGYMTEQGIEQRLRDSRVAMIYEGTNELQANDLLVRKVLDRERGGFADLLVLIRDEATQASDGLPSQWATRIKAACLDLQVWVEGVPEGEDAEYPYCAAGDFLQALAILLLGHVWLRTVRLVANSPTSQSSRRKHQTAEYFFAYLWPRFDYRLQRLNAAAGPLPFAS
jgi:alkylation response protein AidB-like acyl-CoA dehydrogenase